MLDRVTKRVPPRATRARALPGSVGVPGGWLGATLASWGTPEFIFDHVPELFAGVEFWTVGRQVDDPHPGRQTGVAIAKVELGLVANDDVDGIGVRQLKILQVERIPPLVDARDLEKRA